MPTFVKPLFLSLALLGAGCTLFVAKETLYLESAEGRATQDEVQQELGAPRLKTRTPAGESVWIYEVREVEVGSQNSWSSFGSWCDEYVLTFDRQGVLRRWSHKSQPHGGETMPTYCVDNPFMAAS